MKPSAFTVLRIGLGITFFWIGTMIWQDPLGWGAYIQPWALQLLPMPLEGMMQGTAVLDMLIGILFVANLFMPLAAALGTVHLTIVLVTSGINQGTVRDIGLLGSAAAALLQVWPADMKGWLKVRMTHNP